MRFPKKEVAMSKPKAWSGASLAVLLLVLVALPAPVATAAAGGDPAPPPTPSAGQPADGGATAERGVAVDPNG